MYYERPATKKSLSSRKLLCGVGRNDSPYMVKYVDPISKKQYMCPYYSTWMLMIKRCYDPKFHKKYPTYTDCTVCPEWFSFMTFRSWMETQEWYGLQLDKDIILPNNKEYSPKACKFITHAVNSLLLKGRNNTSLPEGVSYDSERDRYKAQISLGNGNTFLGRFNSVSEAQAAYNNIKRKRILEVAAEQTDPDIRNGLLLHSSVYNL